ncbi:hypothetical protein CRG49_008175 [Neisseria sp. N95_16]|uniref:Adhesin n=1 Tax=Neisseria brasiliensis TaxID=2666100 RepID=A0A7X2KYP4_9NEIS|nr:MULTISPECIES: ESPR-type extended signal peptide-containing protein [Neisseria]MRN38237.1 hypothetical protein [Neisseria brasiliensis]PJO09333.1 hypothetical protein CRG49_008175 [Neisseria sp. N95_16]
MNKIYKVVFNEVTGTWSAVAETAKSKGKKSKSSVVVVAAALALTAATPAMAEGLSGGETSHDDSIAIMTGAKAEGNLSVAIGKNAKTYGEKNEEGTINGQNVAIGAGSQAVNGGVSIGYEATSLKADDTPGVNGQSVAIGYSTKARGDQSVAVGANTVSQGNSSVAIGGDDLDAVASTTKPKWDEKNITAEQAKTRNNTEAARKYNEITGDILVHYENVDADNKKSPDAPLRYQPTTTGEGAVAVGVQATAADLATSFGTRTVASGIASVSLGVGSTATKDGSFAAAAGAKSTGVSSVALGAASKAESDSAIAVGNEASATGLASTAIGQGAVASGASSEEQKDGAATAVGRRAKATGDSSTALGSEAEASAKNTVAIGAAAKATKADAVAVGLQAEASGEQAIALGRSSNVSGQHSGAFGSANNVANANTYVLGNSVTTTQDNSVVLGNASADRAATAETQATVGKITYSGFAGVGSPANGVVSVGRAGAGRQIINVAAGNVSAVSTDAINGSQLYATQGVINNVANSVANVLNPKSSNVDKDGKVTANFTVNGNTYNNVQEALANVDTDTVTVVQSEDKSVTVTKKANDKDGNAVYDVAVAKATLTPKGDGTVTNTNPKDNKNSFVTGDDVANAINKSGFKLTTSKSDGEVEGTTEELVNPGDTVTIDAGKNIKLTQANGKVTVATTDDVAFENVTAKTVNVGGNTVTGDQITVNGSPVTNINEAINKTAEQAFKPLTFAGDTGNNFDRKLGTTVNVKGGATGELSDGNIAVESNGSDTLTVKLAKDLKDINSIVVNEGPTINNNGIDMKNDSITNLKDNLPTDGSPTNQTKPADANGNNAATVNDVLNAGWNVQGNGKAKDFVKPYDTVNFVNGQGTTAVVTTDAEGKKTDVTFNVNVDNKTTEYTYVSENGDTVYKHTDGNYYTQPNGKGNKVDTPVTTQVSAKTGTIQYNDGDDSNTNNTSAVDKGKVAPKAGDEDKVTTVQNVADAINASGFTLKTSAVEGGTKDASSTDEEVINPGKVVEMVAGKNLTVKQEANGKVTYSTKDQMVLGEKGEPGENGEDGKPGVDGSLAVNGKDGSAVVINGKDGSIGLKGADGKDGLSLTPKAIVFNGVDGKDGQVSMNFEKAAPALDGKDGQNGADGQTRIVYTKPNGSKEEVATMNDGLKFGANAGDNHEAKLNSLVDIKGADANTNWDKFDKGQNIMTQVESDGEGNGRITIGLAKDLKDIDSITVNNGPTINGDGINMNGDKITNVGPGTDDGDAVNVKQLKASRTTVTSSDNSISVVDTNDGKGDNFAYDIKVNNQAVVENAQLPVVYTNKEGDKVYLVTDADGNKTFNTKPDGSGDAVDNGDIIASMNNAAGDTTKPTTLSNVASNLPATYNTNVYNTEGKPVTTEQKLPEGDNKVNVNNAATVGDVLNAGWNVQGNGKAKDFVKPYDTVNFVDGKGTTAVVTTDAKGEKTDVTFNVDAGNITNNTNGTVTGPVTEELTKALEEAKADQAKLPDTASEADKKAAQDKVDAAQNAVNKAGDQVATAQNVADAINNAGFNTKGKDADGNEVSAQINPGDNVAYVDGKGTKANVKVETTDGVDNVEVTYDVNGKDGNGTTFVTNEDGSIQVNVDAGNITNNEDGSVTGPVTADAKKALEDAKKALADLPADASDADKQAAQKAVDDVQNVVNKAGNQVATAQNVADAINNSGFTLKTSAVEGGEKDKSSAGEEVINPGKTVEMVAGKNLTVKQEADGKVTYSTKDKVEFTKVTAGDTVMDNKGITINNGAAGNRVTLTKDGLNNGGNRITNVAPGVDDTDAVNVSQLKASNANVHNRIDGVESNANAGVAQAMATAGLPQAYLPGKSMMAIGGGVYRGETGYAIGFSSISDGGNWIVKGTASGNSRGNYGATAAVGYQW